MSTHFNSMGNPFWSHLEDSNRFHINIVSKYGTLLDTLRDKKVVFKDIRNHMIREAKKCGLYRKNVWNQTKGEMDYAPKKSLKNLSWYVELSNFCSWVSRNYKDYGVKINRVARKNDRPSPKVVVVREQSPSPQVQEVPAAGATETGKEVVNTSNLKLEKSTTKTGTSGIVQPVPDLTDLQKQTLILQNLDILGKICEEKGCQDEYNALMLALGCEEECI